jgi:hypothetical protein
MYHEGRAMQRLRGAEHLPAKRMRDHDLIRHFHRKQGIPPFDLAPAQG